MGYGLVVYIDYKIKVILSRELNFNALPLAIATKIPYTFEKLSKYLNLDKF